MCSYLWFYCDKCKHEYKIEKDVIYSYSGRKNLLCSTCGDVLIHSAEVREIKKDIMSGVSR